ncbi:MAG: hypothetical protein KGQ28_08365, partial [Hyphomicrobiales bacterium]|nr:hypothetical protein [Hyphomicrobiales bacterium]
MNARDGAFDEADLHAFVDGCATGDKADSIRAAIATDPGLAREVENWRRQNAAIRRAYGAPAPPAGA